MFLLFQTLITVSTFLKYLFLTLSIHMCICTCHCGRQKQDSFEPGVIASCESPNVGGGTQAQVLCKSNQHS